MSDTISVKVDMYTDENGMLGRECNKCEKYFKVKLGTGLSTSHTYCPYCDYEGEANTFWTKAQLEYAKSIAMQKAFDAFLRPALNDLKNTFREIERKSRGSNLTFTYRESGDNFSIPIQYYQELELETNIKCPDCSLEYSVYGLFARCPDCGSSTGFSFFNRSIEILGKQLELLFRIESDNQNREMYLQYVVTKAVSLFDGLGKELRKKKPSIFIGNTKNLFQNILLLDESLGNILSRDNREFPFIVKMFQVRHIIEHNLGIIDEDFIKKTKSSEDNLGKRYKMSYDECKDFLKSIGKIQKIIQKYFNA